MCICVSRFEVVNPLTSKWVYPMDRMEGVKNPPEVRPAVLFMRSLISHHSLQYNMDLKLTYKFDYDTKVVHSFHLEPCLDPTKPSLL